MYALLYTTIECVEHAYYKNLLYAECVYMLYVCIVVHNNRMCEHAYHTNLNVSICSNV